MINLCHATAVFQYNQTQENLFNDINQSSQKIQKYSFSYHPKYVASEMLSKQLKEKFPNILTFFRSHPDYLNIECPKEQKQLIKDYLNQIDLQTPFFTYTIEIISISEQTLKKNQGLFSNIGKGIYSTGSKSFYPDFNLAIKKLLENGEATIIAKPIFLGKLGSPSTLSFTDHTPYLKSKISSDHVVQQLDYIENGFHIKLTPMKHHNQTIEFNLDIQVSNIKLWKNLSDGNYPVLSKSNFDSSFVINIGKKELIAQIIDEKVSENTEGFSPLKDIFLIGSLFKKHTNDKYKSCVLIILEINNKALE